MLKALNLVPTLLLVLCTNHGGAEKQETPAEFLLRYETSVLPIIRKTVLAAWDKEADITEEHTAAYVEASVEMASFVQKMQREALTYLKADTSDLTADQKRQLTMIADIGTDAQTDQDKLKRLKSIISEMEEIYSTAEVCMTSEDKCLKLEPGLTQLLRSSRDCETLSEAWEGWRKQSGKKVKDLYTEYVQLSNDAVKILGHNDLGDYWKSKYDSETFEEDIAQIFEQMMPLYEQLHSYVRRKLKARYGSHVFPATGHIPAHLLGNMWSQTWNNIGDLVNPYKDRPIIDVTEELKKQGYTTRRMFETAEEFFYSLGFANMTETFWSKSMLERPEGRDVVCHASAWDMDAPEDYRIKMCTAINHEDLMTIHHEMGHIQYYMQYDHLPVVYRAGANPGFHEAVGDVISLSVQTRKHLKAIGLLKTAEDQDIESDISFLMTMALEKIAFLPFGYLIDQWRWSVFRNDTTAENYNQDWWNLRCRLQGISAPVRRDSDDFDPAAKYHIVADVAYIRYFVSYVIQFQFYKAACDAAGNTGPLYKCDFYNNKAAGERFMSMLKLGASKPWPEAMEKITGQRRMDAGPLVEYFQPLMDFLKKENGEDYGWQANCPENPPPCRDGSSRLEICTWWTFVMLVVFSIVTSRLR